MQDIEHSGVVVGLGKGCVSVEIERFSGCADCHSKEACCSTDTQRQVVQVKTDASSYHLGDSVVVMIAPAAGKRAVIFGYLFPLIVFLVVFFIAMGTIKHEAWAGLLALASIAPYYGILWLFRERIGKSFKTTLRKAS